METFEQWWSHFRPNYINSNTKFVAEHAWDAGRKNMKAMPTIKKTVSLEKINLELSPREAYLLAILIGGIDYNLMKTIIHKYAEDCPWAHKSRLQKGVLSPLKEEEVEDIHNIYDVIKSVFESHENSI